jgi:serine/threonine protein kinase
MIDNTSRIDSGTDRIDGTMRIGAQGSNDSGEAIDAGKTIVLNGKICTVQSRLNRISGEALVYKVSIDGKPYALKHYRIDRPLSDTAHKALGRIKDRPKNRVVRIYDFGKYNGQDFEIMEFAEGGTLSAYLENSGAVQNIQQLKNIVRQIHEGLRQLHSEYRIIYQDLKPENIYFRDAAQTAIVLADFGISSVMEDDDDEAEVIANLTDLYAAPELARKGDRREVVVTPAVDYFALGITMFELWLGEEPFKGMKPAKRDYIIRNKDVIFPPGMNEDCKALVQGLLDPMPKARWGDQHVQKWLNGVTLSVSATRSYDEAIALYKAGRFDEAVPLLQTLADQGSARAQNKLGECYYNANGVGYGEKKALEWFLKAAKNGNADAFANLGECYELGNGVRQNLDKAAKWYRKAAKQGNTDAKEKYDEIMRKKNPPNNPSSSSYSGRSRYDSYDSYNSYNSNKTLMFFLGLLAILPKLIRFAIIPIIILFFIFSSVKFIKKIPDILFGALDSTLEQILGTEDIAGETAFVTVDPSAPPIKEGIYFIRPRIQAKQAGTPQTLYLDRIEVQGRDFKVFFTGAPEGKGGDGHYQPFWNNLSSVKLENQDRPGQTYNVVSADEDDDGNNPLATDGFYNTFRGVTGTRFKLISTAVNPPWIFDEIILEEP